MCRHWVYTHIYIYTHTHKIYVIPEYIYIYTFLGGVRRAMAQRSVTATELSTLSPQEARYPEPSRSVAPRVLRTTRNLQPDANPKQNRGGI